MNTVIINSIGTATPGASKVLSDALKVPQDYMLKLLYNAPSILFQKVDNETALKAEDTLTKLGLDIAICKEDEKIDLTTELVDISVQLNDVLKLPKVVDQLADFLGCKPSEVLNLLLKEPSIVLGNVSVATAKALENRIDANVHFSNPRKDKYTVLISNEESLRTVNNIEKSLRSTAYLKDNVYVIENISYDDSQLFWRKHQSKKTIKLLNQSHQTVSLLLNDFNLDDTNHVSFLVEKVGMPEAILEDVHSALPIVLIDGVNNNKGTNFQRECNEIGLTTSIEKDFNFKKKLHIQNISTSEIADVHKILHQFISKENLPKAGAKEWISTDEMPTIIAKYLAVQLESLACNVEIIN